MSHPRLLLPLVSAVVLLRFSVSSPAAVGDPGERWGSDDGRLIDRIGPRPNSPIEIGGRTCQTDGGACLMAGPKPQGSICTCSISGSVKSGYVRW
jgi:hypothetical protein